MAETYWKTLSRRLVLQFGDGRFLRVESHRVRLPNGHVIEQWPWVITPDFVNIVAQVEDGRFLCFRQTKYAVTGLSLSLAGGYLEPGEAPLEAAQRELLEESGYVAPLWTPLGQFAVDGNRGSGTAHFFLAQGARAVQEADADDLEELDPILLNRAQLEAALVAGEFKVLPWASAVALALNRLRGRSETD